MRLYLWQGGRFTGHEVTAIEATVPCADQTYSLVAAGDLPEAADYAIAMDSLRVPDGGSRIGPLTIAHLG